MTEAEWLACEDPAPMLEWLRGKVSDRQLRLLACACCRRLWHLLTDQRSRQAVEVVERYVDKQATAEQLHEAAIGAAHGADDTHGEGADVADTVADLTSRNAWEGARAAATMLPMLYPAERPLQANIFRDIIGNPFRPATVDPSWLAWNGGTVPKLVQAIYDDRAFDRLPILADALEDAGCTDPDILAHCRGPGPHARGCWVVDLLLGKE
jgi:hypothetical protein